MKKLISLAVVLVLSLGLAMGAGAEASLIPVKIGATAAPHAEVLESIVEDMAALGYALEIQVYDGYVLENPATSDGSLDANYFQHAPYLASYNATVADQDKLVSVASVHYEPMGIYSKELKDLDELKDGAVVALPNDESNETRALLLLQTAGLITLPEDVTASSSITILDIVENPKNLKFNEMEAAVLPTTMEDADISVINGNYAIDAGLKPSQDALLLEASDSDFVKTYPNIVAVRADRAEEDFVKALQTCLCSEKVKAFMEETYSGGVVPLF